MQKYNIYSVYDLKANAYGTPFFKQNDQIAVRDFSNVCLDPNSLLSRNPEDFRLVKLGSFNDETAAIESDLPEFIASAVDCCNKSDEKLRLIESGAGFDETKK